MKILKCLKCGAEVEVIKEKEKIENDIDNCLKLFEGV